jgi:hypothetical protein
MAAQLLFGDGDGDPPNPTPSPTSTTTASHASAHQQQRTTTLHIAHLSSTPLVRKDKNGRRTSLEQLDVKQEKRLLLRSLREAGRRVRVRFDTATSDNLRKMVTLGTRALHYSGHGLKNELVFEDKYGQHHGLDNSRLRELITAGGGASGIQFVFVSACHSQSAGEAFANAGVKHVVAVQRNKRVSDNASVKFSEQFYLALLMGRTVRESFDIGLAALAAAPDQRTRADAQHMFMLLPEDGDHNVPVFGDLEVVDGNQNDNNAVVVDTTPRRPINRCDKPPALFAGRNLETQQVYELLMHSSNRCVTIHGPPGIGKTAVASRVCEYVQDHRTFDAVYMVRLSSSSSCDGHGEGNNGGSSKIGVVSEVEEEEGKNSSVVVENPEEQSRAEEEDRFNRDGGRHNNNNNNSSTKGRERRGGAEQEIHFLHAFWESVGGHDRNRSSSGGGGSGKTVNADDEMTFFDHLENMSCRILLVLDGVQDVKMLTSFRRFLARMLSTVDDVSLLCTTTGRDIIGGENLHGNVEKLVRLEGINPWDSARLLMARCPRKMSIRELGQGATISKALEIMSRHASIQQLEGNPR